MRKTVHRITTLILLLSITVFAFSQQPVRDSTRTPGGFNRPTTGPRPYREVITDKAVTRNGFFKVHKVEDKYFFEIPSDMFGREILIVNRLSKTQAGEGYGGDQIGQNVIRFERGPNNKVFIRTISYSVYAKDTTSSMFSSVRNSNVQPIAASFDIRAFGKDSRCPTQTNDHFRAGCRERLTRADVERHPLPPP